MLIALHSKHPRSGKDTAADHLVKEHGFLKDSFGGEIYNEVAPAFGVTVEQLASDFWKRNDVPELALKNCINAEFIHTILPLLLPAYTAPNRDVQALEAPRSSRFILQRWATEYRRKQDIGYWVRKLDDRLFPLFLRSDLREHDIVISDLREEHEYEYLCGLASTYGLRFRVIEIYREGTVGSTHSSDAGISPYHIHTRMENVNGRPEILLSAISRTFNNIKRTV